MKKIINLLSITILIGAFNIGTAYAYHIQCTSQTGTTDTLGCPDDETTEECSCWWEDNGGNGYDCPYCVEAMEPPLPPLGSVPGISKNYTPAPSNMNGGERR